MRLLAFLILIALLIAPVVALPNTQPATLVGTNNATLNGNGAATTCWFIWGTSNLGNETWRTPNQTSSGGVCTYRIHGSPIMGSTVFYFKVCDTTGCSANELSFTTGTVTPIPTVTYGSIFDNLTENAMDLTLVGYQSTFPYQWLVPTFATLIWGLIFAFIFLGMWLRGRDVTVPALVGFITSSFLFLGNQGLNLGIPVEFTTLAQGLMYASIAGIILALIKK